MSAFLWDENGWYDLLDVKNHPHRSGLRCRFDEGVDPVLRNECLRFASWLRREYVFPLRVPVYFKNTKCLKCIDGDPAYGTCFLPDTYQKEPYIRIAVGDYDDLCREWGEKDATLAVLRTIAHELTHYYQWINGIHLSSTKVEQQAKRISKRIVEYYLGYLSEN